MRTDATTRGIPPLGVFLFTQTRRGGVLPFSFVFLCTQTRRGGPPPLVRVSIQRGGDLPFLFVFLLTQTRREGVSPFSASFCSHRHDEEGSPPPRHLLSMLCEREGSTPPLSTPFDTTREGATPSRLLLTAFDEGSTPSPLLFDAFRVGLTPPPSFDAVRRKWGGFNTLPICFHCHRVGLNSTCFSIQRCAWDDRSEETRRQKGWQGNGRTTTRAGGRRAW